MLTRLGHLALEEGETYLAGCVIYPDDVMTPLQAAAANYRIAHGPRAGQKVLSLQLAPRRPARGGESPALCANAHGFSQHAGVRCRADDRQGLEQLCRYITRPAIANERLGVNRAGQVVLKLKTAWRDGTSHHVMTPMEFMQRLAALVPRPDSLKSTHRVREALSMSKPKHPCSPDRSARADQGIDLAASTAGFRLPVTQAPSNFR